jgi:hypothetical protein
MTLFLHISLGEGGDHLLHAPVLPLVFLKGQLCELCVLIYIHQRIQYQNHLDSLLVVNEVHLQGALLHVRRSSLQKLQ